MCEGEGTVCEDDGLLCKSDVMGVKVKGWCMKVM